MKHFLYKVALFVIFVIIFDCIVGNTSEYLRSHAKGGSTANNYYIAESLEDDIVILGSSRATHHYIPDIIEDSLGLSCYNCGEEGNGIILAYGRYKMITDHHTPKLIIYEVTPEYDWMICDNSKFTRYLKPYCHYDEIYDLVISCSEKNEKYKLCSKMYRNNSSLLTYAVDNVVYRDNMKGYSPLYGIMNGSQNNSDAVESTFELDYFKLALLNNMMADAKSLGIQMLFVVSPYYYKITPDNYYPIISLCERNSVVFLDLSNIDGITGNMEVFNDAGHLNHKGATAYTIYLSNILNQISTTI